MSSAHILDDDSLLNTLRLYRLIVFDEEKTDDHQIFAEESVHEVGTNAGGTSLRTSVEDGGPSYSDQHPTSIFALFARIAHQ